MEKNTLLAFVMGILSSLTPAQDSCECNVTNQVTVVTASGQCNQSGQGPIDCFQYTIGTVPGQLTTADPGECVCIVEGNPDPICGPADACDFYPVRITVTAAACFSSCGGYDGILPTWSNTDYLLKTNPLSAGGTAVLDVKARAAAACGDGAIDIHITYQKRTGDIIFELRVRYGCAQCQEKVDNPNCQ